MLQTAERAALSLNAVLLAGFFSVLALAAGLMSTPCLGDEISFYRLAEGFFRDHARWTIDPVYLRSGLVYYYNSEPFWPALLGAVWTLTGSESAASAQIYHCLYFFVLLFSTYKLARTWFPEKQSLFAVLILAAIPMAPAFGILFYAEVPMTAFAVTALWLLLREKTASAGILMALACLTKLTAVFFLPAMTALILFQKISFRRKTIALAWFAGPALLALAADFAWRKNHLNIAYLFTYEPGAVTSPSAWQTLIDRFFQKDTVQRFKELKQSGLWEYTSSSFLSLADLVKYFGPVCLFLCAPLLQKKNRPEGGGREGLRICLIMASGYLVCCLYIFLFCPDVRGLLPIAPFLAILASLTAARAGRTAAVILAAMCMLQFTASILHVVKERQVPQEIRQGFEFIRKNVPRDGLVLYPEYILLKESDRGMVWSHRFRAQMTELFWNDDRTLILDYLYRHKLRTIAVKKTRVYDDKAQRHFGGYPESFVTSLPRQQEVKLVYENNSMSIWNILPKKTGAS